MSREVGQVVGEAPGEVVISADRASPEGVRVELWCADRSWCEAAAERLGGDPAEGFVAVTFRRPPLRPA